MRGRLVAVALMAAGAALGGCAAHRGTATSSSPGQSAASPTPSARGWVEDAVSFPVRDMTVYATYRHPTGQGWRGAAALLIAGSGPTDRDGNSKLLPGQVGTLQSLAQTLSDDGMASLRYDKLGSGQTGLGPYAEDPTKGGVTVFQ